MPVNKLIANALFLLTPVAVLAYSGNAAAVGETVSIGGKAGDQSSYASTTWSSISGDGRYVTLTAMASFFQHVFLYDRYTGAVKNLTGAGNSISLASDISADGRFVAFRSSSSNLVDKDGNGAVDDIFLQDLQTGKNVLVSKASDGGQANDISHFAAVSGDGQYVAFSSSASNLVGKDTNNAADIFRYDRKTGKTARVSVSSTGAEAASGVSNGVVDISADGRYVVFSSFSKNLAAGDSNNEDVFLRDVKSGVTTWVSRPVRNTGWDSGSSHPSISADGRYIAFVSGSSKLLANDTDDVNSDIFVYDRVKKTSQKITQNADGNSIYPAISGDGRFVAFMSGASNLVDDDTNSTWDSFIADRNTGKISRVNLTPDNSQSTGDAAFYLLARPMLSADGRFIAFESGAKDLTSDDTDSAYTDVFLRDRLLNKQKMADIGVTLSAPDSVRNGLSFSYVVTVTNKGWATASQTNAIMTFPENLTLVSVTPGQGSCQKAAVTVCRLGAIGKGASVKIQVKVSAIGAGKATVTTVSESVEKDAVHANNAVTKVMTIF